MGDTEQLDDTVDHQEMILWNAGCLTITDDDI